MAPNRIADACRAMESHGFSKTKTKAALKKLLKLYDNSWEFIIEDDYKVLFEAIKVKEQEEERVKHEKAKDCLDQKSKVVKSQEKEFPHCKPEVQLKSKRLRTRNQIKQALLQEDSKLLLADSAPSVQEHQSVADMYSESETEDCEPLVRRKRSRCQSELAPVPVENPFCVDFCEDELPQFCCKEEVDEAAHSEGGNDLACPVASMLDLHHSNDLLQVEAPPVALLLDGCSDGKDSKVEADDMKFMESKSLDVEDKDGCSDGKDSKVEADDLKFMESKSLDMEDKASPDLSCVNDSSNGNGSHATKDGLELQVSAETLNRYKVGSDSDWLQIDITSSPNGKVKMALLCNSSQQSAFHGPSFDAVLKVVEKRCIETYRINDPKFSLMKLMTELCEGFLTMGNGTILDETSVSKNLPPFQGGHYIPSSLPDKPFKFQNLVKVLLQIPKPITSSGLEGFHCMNHFMMEDTESISCKNSKRLKLLEGPQSIQSCNEAVKHSIYVDDIARGEEMTKITLVFGSDSDYLPCFLYIPRNIVYHKACVNFALDLISNEDCCSQCFGDCLSSPTPCACAYKTGDEFAYTPGGLLKEKFLEDCISMNWQPKGDCYSEKFQADSSKNRSVARDGHLRRKFIKECWAKCGCVKKCGNRVVQRGITVNMQVFLTPEGKGWGLRTLEHLPKGAFVCEYVGEIVTNKELQRRNMQNVGSEKPTYQVLLDADYGSEGVSMDEESLCLDATCYGNVARFINHRCSDASLVEIPVEVETPDRRYYHVALFTTRKVHAMEELTRDYGIDFEDKDNPVGAFSCLCGSSYCRQGRLDGKAT